MNSGKRQNGHFSIPLEVSQVRVLYIYINIYIHAHTTAGEGGDSVVLGDPEAKKLAL
jgi:hypothetical protein